MKLAIVLLRDRHLALASILLIAPLRGVMSHVNGVISMLGDTCFEQGYVISLSYCSHSRSAVAICDCCAGAWSRRTAGIAAAE
jgi:hypothetical protein